MRGTYNHLLTNVPRMQVRTIGEAWRRSGGGRRRHMPSQAELDLRRISTPNTSVSATMKLPISQR